MLALQSSKIGLKYIMLTSKQEFKKIAALAYLEADAKSAQQLTSDVSSIMGFVEQLRAVETTSVTPLIHPLELHQRLRLDEVHQTPCIEQLAAIAPSFTKDLYLVPKIIESGK